MYHYGCHIVFSLVTNGPIDNRLTQWPETGCNIHLLLCLERKKHVSATCEMAVWVTKGLGKCNSSVYRDVETFVCWSEEDCLYSELGILENVLWRKLEQMRQVIHWTAGKNYILSNFRTCALVRLVQDYCHCTLSCQNRSFISKTVLFGTGQKERVLFWCVLAKLRKATISVIMPVCPYGTILSLNGFP